MKKNKLKTELGKKKNMWNRHKLGVEVWTNAGAYSKTVQNGATQGRRIRGVAKSRSRGSGRVMEKMIL